jgi:hypothetical protein
MIKIIMSNGKEKQETDVEVQYIDGTRTIIVKIVGDKERFPLPEKLQEVYNSEKTLNPSAEIVVVPIGIDVTIEDTEHKSKLIIL